MLSFKFKFNEDAGKIRTKRTGTALQFAIDDVQLESCKVHLTLSVTVSSGYPDDYGT